MKKSFVLFLTAAFLLSFAGMTGGGAAAYGTQARALSAIGEALSAYYQTSESIHTVTVVADMAAFAPDTRFVNAMLLEEAESQADSDITMNAIPYNIRFLDQFDTEQEFTGNGRFEIRFRTEADLASGRFFVWVCSDLLDALLTGSSFLEGEAPEWENLNAPLLTAVSFHAGDIIGTTKITLPAADGTNRFVYETGGGFPANIFVDTIKAVAEVAGNDHIAVAPGQFIAVYEVNAFNQVKKYFTAQITSDSIKPIPGGYADALAVTIVKGEQAGAATIQAAANPENKIVYKIQAAEFPPGMLANIAVHDGSDALVNVPLTVGSYIAVYEISRADYTVKRYFTRKITAADVRLPVPVLAAAVEKGASQQSSIQIHYPAADGTKLVYEFTDRPIEGDAMTSGSIIKGKQNYSEGTDIVNVPAGKYINLYRVGTRNDDLLEFVSVFITVDKVNMRPIDKIIIIFKNTMVTSDEVKAFISANIADAALFAAQSAGKYGSLSENGKTRAAAYMIERKQAVISAGESGAFRALFTEAVDYASAYPGTTGGSSGGNPGTGTKAVNPAVSANAVNADSGGDVFEDLDSVPWAKSAIKALAAAGIISGVTPTSFAPEQPLTREQFVKLVVLTFQGYREDADCSFSDVPKDSWFYRYVASAVKMGITKGINEDEFGAGQSLTREQMATMIARAAEAVEVELAPQNPKKVFNDEAEISEWSKQAVALMQIYGIMSGDDRGNFAPQSVATRAEAAVAIHNIYQIVR